jgi:hypothetical protein
VHTSYYIYIIYIYATSYTEYVDANVIIQYMDSHASLENGVYSTTYMSRRFHVALIAQAIYMYKPSIG